MGHLTFADHTLAAENPGGIGWPEASTHTLATRPSDPGAPQPLNAVAASIVNDIRMAVLAVVRATRRKTLSSLEFPTFTGRIGRRRPAGA